MRLWLLILSFQWENTTPGSWKNKQRGWLWKRAHKVRNLFREKSTLTLFGIKKQLGIKKTILLKEYCCWKYIDPHILGYFDQILQMWFKQMFSNNGLSLKFWMDAIFFLRKQRWHCKSWCNWETSWQLEGNKEEKERNRRSQIKKKKTTWKSRDWDEIKSFQEPYSSHIWRKTGRDRTSHTLGKKQDPETR